MHTYSYICYKWCTLPPAGLDVLAVGAIREVGGAVAVEPAAAVMAVHVEADTLVQRAAKLLAFLPLQASVKGGAYDDTRICGRSCQTCGCFRVFWGGA